MKRLLPVLMVLGLFLGNVGESFALPKCEGSYNRSTWTNCFGTIIHANGNKYVGEFKGGNYYGQGTYTYGSGDKYVGEWMNYLRHGQGIYTYADGRVKEGIWTYGWLKYAKKGTPTVTAKKSPAPSSVNYQSSLRECPGSYKKYTWTSCFGTYIFLNGNKYIGEWKDGKQHGQGTYTFANGNKYVGKFKDNQRHGQGTYTYASGHGYVRAVLEGIFENNEFKYAQKVTPTVTSKKPSKDNLQKGLDALKQRDYSTALSELEPLAEKGNATAQIKLGWIYKRGQGVPKDHTTAAKWFMLAASKGNADAQYILGGLYRRGKGVPKNQEIALNWYRLAAKQGHELAQNRIKKLGTNQKTAAKSAAKKTPPTLDVTLPSSLEANIVTLKRTKSCPKCYLRGANLLDANLQGANLGNANLQRATLGYANLQRANLQRATLYRANLGNANLQRANLLGATLQRATLYGAKLQNANLNLANLKNANLTDANLGGTSLNSANLQRAILRGANLNAAYIQGAKLQGADLQGANLQGAMLFWSQP